MVVLGFQEGPGFLGKISLQSEVDRDETIPEEDADLGLRIWWELPPNFVMWATTNTLVGWVI